MFTVCPKCSLTLVVTAADLRVAQGYVRCGRCSNVFNALNALSDERQLEPQGQAAMAEAEPAPPIEPHAPPQPKPEPEPEPTPQPEPEEAQAGVVETQAAEEPPEEELEFDPTSTRVEEVFLTAPGEGDETTGTFESIVLESEESEEIEALEQIDEAEAELAVAPAEQILEAPPDDDRALEQELQSLALRLDSQNRAPAPDHSSGIQKISRSTAETLQELGVTVGVEPDADDDDESRVPAWVWHAGVAALVILLLGQTVHHYRRDLAVVPQLGGPLAALYGALGASLEPRWDVRAYDVHQLGATSDPAAPNRLIVRASIKNAAPRPQPLPLLRVAVQDRFGNRIASSDVTPSAYAPRNMSPQIRLASGQRVDVEMRFVDPGTEAVGFEIDACLAAPGGGVNCANH